MASPAFSASLTCMVGQAKTNNLPDKLNKFVCCVMLELSRPKHLMRSLAVVHLKYLCALQAQSQTRHNTLFPYPCGCGLPLMLKEEGERARALPSGAPRLSCGRPHSLPALLIHPAAAPALQSICCCTGARPLLDCAPQLLSQGLSCHLL